MVKFIVFYGAVNGKMPKPTCFSDKTFTRSPVFSRKNPERTLHKNPIKREKKPLFYYFLQAQVCESCTYISQFFYQPSQHILYLPKMQCQTRPIPVWFPFYLRKQGQFKTSRTRQAGKNTGPIFWALHELRVHKVLRLEHNAITYMNVSMVFTAYLEKMLAERQGNK